MQRGKVLVVGSANMDLVFGTPRFPRPGETVLGDTFATFPGGKGANQAVAAAKLGADVAFLGKLGADAFGDSLLSSIGAAGADVSRVLRDETTSTGTAMILVDPSAQNLIVAVPGANTRLTAQEVTAAIVDLQPAVVLTQLETSMEAVAAAAFDRPEGSFFILNPAPAAPVPSEILARVDLITPNETEAEFLTGVRPGDDAECLACADRFFEMGVSAVLFTLGARGSFYASRDGGRHYPTLNVRAVDTTAAGDAFNGGLAAFLAEGMSLERAILLANCVGALSTTKPGAQASMPTRSEVEGEAGALFEAGLGSLGL